MYQSAAEMFFEASLPPPLSDAHYDAGFYVSISHLIPDFSFLYILIFHFFPFPY